MKIENQEEPHVKFAALGHAIGRTRYVVLIAVVAVLLVAFSLFMMGAIEAIKAVWQAWPGLLQGKTNESRLTVEFLQIVSIMLKAVVFYIIGVGLYSLFITPLNLTVSLGVETLEDLEGKVLSVVVVIMSVTFLEHFIQWKKPMETLQFGGALAIVVTSLVFFQMHSHRAKEDKKANNPDVQVRSQRELFQGNHEKHVITPDEVAGTNNKVDQKTEG